MERRKAVEKLIRNTSSLEEDGNGEHLPELADDSAAIITDGSKKIATLQQKWTMLWRMSVDMKKKLQDNFAHLLQVSQH